MLHRHFFFCERSILCAQYCKMCFFLLLIFIPHSAHRKKDVPCSIMTFSPKSVPGFTGNFETNRGGRVFVHSQKYRVQIDQTRRFARLSCRKILANLPPRSFLLLPIVWLIQKLLLNDVAFKRSFFFIIPAAS